MIARVVEMTEFYTSSRDTSSSDMEVATKKSTK